MGEGIKGRGILEYHWSWPRSPTPCDLVPLWAGEFVSHADWVSFATKRLSNAAGDKYGAMQAICVDSLGRRCTIGAHFMRARDEGTYPIRYFWECTPSDRDVSLAEHSSPGSTAFRKAE